MSDNLRDEIAKALYDLVRLDPNWPTAPDETRQSYREDADAFMPLIRRAQAEAWEKGHAIGWHQACAYRDDPAHTPRNNPYIENEGGK